MDGKRIKQLKMHMEELNLDAALICLSENVLLLSEGFWSRNGLAFVFVPRDGEGTLIVPKPEAEDIAEDCLLGVRTFGWVMLKEGNAYDNIANILKSLKEEHGLSDQSRIGMDMYPQTVTPALCDGEIVLPGGLTRAAVHKAFPLAQVEDLSPHLIQMRRCKLPDEIGRIARANAVALEAIQYFKQLMLHANGLREIDVASMVESYVARNAGSFGARYGRAWAQITSGIRTADGWNAGLVTTDRRILAGDLVMIEMGTIVDGYFCDLSATHYMEKANDQQLHMLYLVEKAQEEALSAVIAGAKASEVDGAARSFLTGEGMGEYFVHGTGHGVGFSYHDGAPALGPSSIDVLEAGMIHSVEPGIYIPDVGGVRFEVNVLVTDSGCRVLGIN